MRLITILFAAVCLLTSVPLGMAGDAPQWMHALVNVPLPAHDEKTDAVCEGGDSRDGDSHTRRIRIRTTSRRANRRRAVRPASSKGMTVPCGSSR